MQIGRTSDRGIGAGGCVTEEPFAGPDPTPDDQARAVAPELFSTCGDPVCHGWTAKALPRCRSHAAGDPCDVAFLGKECAPHDACNATLMCTDTDPISGGCPISRRAAKKDIDYLDASRRDALHDQLIDMHLATYRYNEEDAASPTHLGFIIDDVLPSPAVAANGQRVDLYAYTSMAVAALQVQQQQIDELKAQVAALKAERAK